MDRLELHVTQEDIDTAGQSCSTCPIAKALERRFPDCEPFVGAETSVSFWHGTEHVRFPHTYESLEFVHTYDYVGEHMVKPCTLVFTAGPLHV